MPKQESPDFFEKAEENLKKFLKIKPQEELKAKEVDLTKLNEQELIDYFKHRMQPVYADPQKHLELFLEKMKPEELRNLEAEYEKDLEYLDKSTDVMNVESLKPIEIFQENLIKYAENLPNKDEEKEKVEYLARTMCLVMDLIKAGIKKRKEKVLDEQIQKSLNLNNLHEAVSAYKKIESKIELSEKQKLEIISAWLIPGRKPEDIDPANREVILDHNLRKSLFDALNSIDLTAHILAKLKYPEKFEQQMED